MKINTYIIIIIYSLILISCTSCENQNTTIIDLLSYVDTIPPSLIKINGNSHYAFSLTFSEKLKDRHSTKVFFEDNETNSFKIDGYSLIIYSKDELIPGKKYYIKAEVADLSGNTTIVESYCFAKNINPARLLISEISTKGTTKYGDRVELICTKSGNLAGICIADGFNYNYGDRCVLPNREAYEGDLIVIAFADNCECDERSEKRQGLSSNNGCIIISENPEVDSPIQDCIIYSNKSSSTFSGFASRVVEERVKTLVDLGEWESDTPLSSAAVDSTNSTSTRSINRHSDKWGNYSDTNTQDDFYVTVTSGQSFGTKNNPNVYEKYN